MIFPNDSLMKIYFPFLHAVYVLRKQEGIAEV